MAQLAKGFASRVDDPEQSIEWFKRAAALADTVDSTWTSAICCGELSMMLALHGDPHEALQLGLAQVLAFRRAGGHRPCTCLHPPPGPRPSPPDRRPPAPRRRDPPRRNRRPTAGPRTLHRRRRRTRLRTDHRSPRTRRRRCGPLARSPHARRRNTRARPQHHPHGNKPATSSASSAKTEEVVSYFRDRRQQRFKGVNSPVHVRPLRRCRLQFARLNRLSCPSRSRPAFRTDCWHAAGLQSKLW